MNSHWTGITLVETLLERVPPLLFVRVLTSPICSNILLNLPEAEQKCQILSGSNGTSSVSQKVEVTKSNQIRELMLQELQPSYLYQLGQTYLIFLLDISPIHLCYTLALLLSSSLVSLFNVCCRNDSGKRAVALGLHGASSPQPPWPGSGQTCNFEPAPDALVCVHRAEFLQRVPRSPTRCARDTLRTGKELVKV